MRLERHCIGDEAKARMLGLEKESVEGSADGDGHVEWLSFFIMRRRG